MTQFLRPFGFDSVPLKGTKGCRIIEIGGGWGGGWIGGGLKKNFK